MHHSVTFNFKLKLPAYQPRGFHESFIYHNLRSPFLHQWDSTLRLHAKGSRQHLNLVKLRILAEQILLAQLQLLARVDICITTYSFKTTNAYNVRQVAEILASSNCFPTATACIQRKLASNSRLHSGNYTSNCATCNPHCPYSTRRCQPRKTAGTCIDLKLQQMAPSIYSSKHHSTICRRRMTSAHLQLRTYKQTSILHSTPFFSKY